ncbi:hypothetical protein RCOM_1074840 [Ricinus communis]|uniref:RNase H type-1 domain-containing protein n=1 Tax=Ricinus communis TaxID=3988 RepID=B9SMG4_RICCO|nr:hypothetical protein RCOM_1074840 [Ricinus communis]
MGTKNVEKLNFSQNSMHEDARVAELIDVDQKQWKVDVICKNFSNDEATKIISMPISFRLPNDKQYWQYPISGKFSVRSTYHLAILTISSQTTTRPNQSVSDPLWKKIWQVNVPSKVRHFLWRACGTGQSSAPNRTLAAARRTTYGTWTHCLQRSNCFSVVVRLTPPTRLCFEAVEFRLMDTAERAQSRLLEFKDYQQRMSVPTQGSTDEVRWQAPVKGMGKVNADAAIYKDGTTGFGCVVRDMSGKVLLAGARRVQMEGSTVVAEALTIRWALETICASGIRDIIMENDCKIVIDGLNDKGCPEIYGEMLLPDTTTIVENIDVPQFVFDKCDANRVTHC